MNSENLATEKLAAALLSKSGMGCIWRAQFAAAYAYEAGRVEVASSLVQLADDAERQWLYLACTDFDTRDREKETAALTLRGGRP